MEMKIRSTVPGELGHPLARLAIRAKGRTRIEIVGAWGFDLSHGFLVLRGSEAFIATASKARDAAYAEVRELRDALVADEILRQEVDVYVFQTDYVFRSSSLAASVILGRTASGPNEWRDENGTTLADLLSPEAAAACGVQVCACATLLLSHRDGAVTE